MNTGMKIGAAVVGGYVLGRRRKAKLAIGLGTWLVGKKLNLDPKKLMVDLSKELRSSPQLAGLRDQLRVELLDATKGMAGSLISSQTDRLADSLHARTERLRNPVKDEDQSGQEEESSSAEEQTDDGSSKSRSTRTRDDSSEDDSASEDQGEQKPTSTTSSKSTGARRATSKSTSTRDSGTRSTRRPTSG